MTELAEPDLEPARALVKAAQAAQPVRTKGVAVTQSWDWELVDESAVPEHLKSCDVKKVTAAVKAGAREIPGIRIFEVAKVVARS